MALPAKPITGHTHLISLLGDPITHSQSPTTHNLSFQIMGVDAVYLVFTVDQTGLPFILNAMRHAKGWDGSNVTMPNKQAVIQYLDGLSAGAELSGAVNVIEKTADGKLIGHNSDGIGFVRNLLKHGIDPKGKTFTLIGSGGAGSAIMAQTAIDGAARINVFERKDNPFYERAIKRLELISEKTACQLQIYAVEDEDALGASIAESDVLVNATPVGMGEEGNPNTPVPAELIKEGMVVTDACYIPVMTQLLRDAKAKNCTIITGLGMMYEQAAVSEKIWYGIDMPIEEVIVRSQQ